MSRVDISAIKELPPKKWALYHKHADECSPCNAYLTLDEDGYVDTYVSYSGGRPLAWINNKVLHWIVSPVLVNFQLQQLVETILPLLKKIHRGYTVDYRPDIDQVAGLLTNSAQKAYDDIDIAIKEFQYDCDEMPPWDFSSWDDDLPIDVLWPEEMNLDEAEIYLDECFEKQGIISSFITKDVLLHNAELLFENDEELHKNQIIGLFEDGSITKQEIIEYSERHPDIDIGDMEGWIKGEGCEK